MTAVWQCITRQYGLKQKCVASIQALLNLLLQSYHQPGDVDLVIREDMEIRFI
jgi:hypothetical protein